MSPILKNRIDIITHSIWYSYIGHFWLFFPRSLKFDKLIWILLSLLPSRSWSSLWWQGQWIVSRLRLMEHGWRGRSCNQALRREEGPHLTLCWDGRRRRYWGASHRGRCEPGGQCECNWWEFISNTLDRSTPWMPDLLCLELGEYIKYKYIKYK